LPSAKIPLGYIKYSFVESIILTFRRYPTFVREAFIGSLLILEVVDFLDGRTITTYSTLAFGLDPDSIFVENQGYHAEDTIRALPFLLNYMFTPRIPADPFEHIGVYPDNVPLVIT
jgi:hypothetical protein